jgi:DNA-binding LacI/PurR family transcriptional regulator
VASVRDDVNVVSCIKGIYARAARKLKVSPSMVSRVANGLRSSPKIKKALLEELHAIKQKLDAVP